MKDELKNFVNSNRAAFDDQEPSKKIWGRIESGLPVMQQRSLWNSLAVWRVAAAIFFGLAVYLLLARPSDPTMPGKHEVAQTQREFSDTELFYRHEIEQKIELINRYDATGQNDQITHSFQKLDAMYQVLADELKNNPDRKVRDAMILNLLVRIDLLNQQLHLLENKKTKSAAVV